MQLPAWFISRRNGWMPFGYVEVKDQENLQVTDSMLVRFFVRSFGVDTDQLSFSNGFCLVASNGDTVIIRVARFCTIADMDQHTKSFNLKGPSGKIPCVICRNCIGRCDEFQHQYLVHIFACEYDKHDYHTPETFAEVCDELKAIYDSGNNALLEKREKEVGIKFDIDAVLWDLQVRSMLRPPLCIYPDYMHPAVALLQSESDGEYCVCSLDVADVSTETVSSKDLPITGSELLLRHHRHP